MPVPSNTQSAPDSHGPKRSVVSSSDLIPSCPSEDAQIDHEDGCQNDTDSDDVNGLDRRDNPFVGLNRQTERGLREPLGEVNHRCFLSNRGLTPAITVFPLIKMQCRRGFVSLTESQCLPAAGLAPCRPSGHFAIAPTLDPKLLPSRSGLSFTLKIVPAGKATGRDALWGHSSGAGHLDAPGDRLSIGAPQRFSVRPERHKVESRHDWPERQTASRRQSRSRSWSDRTSRTNDGPLPVRQTGPGNERSQCGDRARPVVYIIFSSRTSIFSCRPAGPGYQAHRPEGRPAACPSPTSKYFSQFCAQGRP